MKASSSQYFEIVDYYNASNLEEFIQSCCEMIQEIEIHNKSYSKDFSFQNSSFKITYLLTGSCHIARFINSHLILLESKNVEDETIKLVSACFQIALKGVPIPFFYNLKLDGWFSGFLELNDRSISFAVRCAYGYIKDDQWFQLFREKLELNGIN